VTARLQTVQHNAGTALVRLVSAVAACSQWSNRRGAELIMRAGR
jgi:hypothetical protein